jgi:hypothetical protein
MPIEMRMPVRMVGAAAGRITRKALRSGLTSSVRATLIQSRRTVATPNAVLISIGQIEQMKMTKMPEADESFRLYNASGIQASGEMGFSTWMKGSKALNSSGDMPIAKPTGSATITASRKPTATRASECAIWMPMPLSFGPLS